MILLQLEFSVCHTERSFLALHRQIDFDKVHLPDFSSRIIHSNWKQFTPAPVTSRVPGRSHEMQFEVAIGHFALEVSRRLNDRSRRLRLRRAKQLRRTVLGHPN